jgi:hypothetical protein
MLPTKKLLAHVYLDLKSQYSRFIGINLAPLVSLKELETGIFSLVLRKVYVNRCVRGNSEFNRDLVFPLNLLLPLRHPFTQNLFKKSLKIRCSCCRRLGDSGLHEARDEGLPGHSYIHISSSRNFKQRP